MYLLEIANAIKIAEGSVYTTYRNIWACARSVQSGCRVSSNSTENNNNLMQISFSETIIEKLEKRWNECIVLNVHYVDDENRFLPKCNLFNGLPTDLLSDVLNEWH